MNVEIGTEAAQFPVKEYINGIFLAVRRVSKVKWFVLGEGAEEPISCKAHCTGKPETLLYLYENVKSSKVGISPPLFGYLGKG
jgi:hypothetical protein